jgi:hypothetical protein
MLVNSISNVCVYVFNNCTFAGTEYTSTSFIPSELPSVAFQSPFRK